MIFVFFDDLCYDVILYIDQYSGKVFVDVCWQDYNVVVRSVQMGVVLYEGKFFGFGNQLLMFVVCLVILFSLVSGLWIWWKCKLVGCFGVLLLCYELLCWKSGIVIMLVLGVVFLLVGVLFLLVWVLDWLVLLWLLVVCWVLV